MEPITEPVSYNTRKIKSKFSILKRNAEIENEKNNQSTSYFSHTNEIGKEIGLEIFKIIDNDTIQKVPKMNHSIFETNKSYLLLMTQFYNGNMNIKNHNIHFWIGELLIGSQETINFCNERVDELERIIKGNQQQFESTVQHPESIHYREFQGKESDLFMSYFKTYGGPRYTSPLKLSNTAATVASEASKYKLFHLKGRRNIRVKQVDCVAKSLNSGDVFILDCQDFIYQWNGSESSRLEKGKGLDLTVRLRDEKSAKAKIIVMDENDTDNEHPEFWKRLGGTKSDVQKSEQGGDDFAYEKKSIEQIKLYKVENVDSEVHLHVIEPIGEVYSTTQLQSEHSYILDCETELYVWCGKKSTTEQKKIATSNAMDLLHEDGRPSWTPIIKMTQGSENTLFKDKFKKGSWGEFVASDYDKVKPSATSKGVASKQAQEKINVDALHNPEKYQLDREDRKSTIPTSRHINDRHRGELKIWHVRDRNKFEISSTEFGLFYNSSCYLVLFTLFSADGNSNSILYYWQGRFSKSEDKGASALLAKDVGKELNRSCIHVRTVQNKEPEHFLEHFQSRMVVFKGERSKVQEISYDSINSNYGMYHVRGTDSINIHSIQVEKLISSLDTNDSFILLNDNTAGKSYIWVGKHSDEKEAAISISKNVFGSHQFELVLEGEEPTQFWDALEIGNTHRNYFKQLRTVEQEMKTRLFQCSNNSGVFKVFEIHDFSQDDLDSDDVMILDNNKQVFVWIGKESSDTEKQMSMETASEYLLNASHDRRDNPIYKIDEGNEPLEFISNFHAWEINKVNQDSYKSKLSNILMGVSPILKPVIQPTSTPSPVVLKPTVTKVATSNPTPVTVTPKPTVTSVATTTSAPTTSSNTPPKPTTFYPSSVLKVKSSIPSDVDQAFVHLYLSDDEFLSIFKSTKDVFNTLPAWKQKNLRQSNNLF